MSSPENPLAYYQSYSYHHILIACADTSTAEALTKSDKFNDFMRGKRDDDLGILTPKSIRHDKGFGKYVIIANGMTDAEFIISNLEWFSTTAASTSTSQGDMFTTMNTDGKFTVQEPRGIRFLNVLNKACDALGSDPTGVIWMIKTIFTGHQLPGAPTNIDGQLTNIKPLLLTIYDITAQFDVTGGRYEISFAGINNGAAKSPQIVKAAEKVTVNLKKKNKLKDVIQALQDIITNQYDKHYDCLVKQFGNNGTLPGRKVRYKILLEKEVAGTDIGYGDEYIVSDAVKEGKDSKNPASGLIFDFSRGMTIENAIKTIMSRCDKVKDDLKGKGTKDKRKYNYKIVSTIQSDDKEYNVIYTIRKFFEPQSDIVQRVLDGKEDAEIKKNTIEFNYMFTGKNTDILDFDIKMEMGLAFFQTLATTDNLKGTACSSDDCGSVAKEQGKRSETDKHRPKTPIFFGSTAKNSQTRNSQNPNNTTDFQTLLSRHAALENLEAKMKIHGNPNLLGSMNRLPSDIANMRKGKGNATDTFPFWETIPALAKVNIKMPSGSKDGDFAEDFWYKDLYYVFGITNTFNEGEFTQVLDMQSLPQKAYFEQKEKEETCAEKLEKRKKEVCSAVEAGEDETKAIKYKTGSVGTASNLEINITYLNSIQGCEKKKKG